MPHHLINIQTDSFWKEPYHILPGQISFFAFSAWISSNSVDAKQCHLGSLEISPAVFGPHASIYSSLHCAHPAWGLITFAQFRGPPLSPLVRPPRHNGRVGDMSRFDDNKAFNCVCDETRGDHRKFKECIGVFTRSSRLIFEAVY